MTGTFSDAKMNKTGTDGEKYSRTLCQSERGTVQAPRKEPARRTLPSRNPNPFAKKAVGAPRAARYSGSASAGKKAERAKATGNGKLGGTADLTAIRPKQRPVWAFGRSALSDHFFK